MLASDNEGVVWTLKNFSRWLVESIHNFQFNAIFFVRNLPALVLRCLFFSRFYEFLLSFFAVVVVIAVVVVVTMLVYFPCGSFLRISFFTVFFSPLRCICLRIYLLPCYYVHTYTMHIKAIARSQCGWTQEEKKAHTHTERSSIHTPDIRNMYFCFLCDFSFCFVTLFRIPFFSFTISFSPIFPYAKYYVCFMLFSTSLKHFCSLSFLNNEIRYCEENMVSKSNWELMHITEINSLAVTLDDRFYRECVFLFRHSSFRKWCFESIFLVCRTNADTHE